MTILVQFEHCLMFSKGCHLAHMNAFSTCQGVVHHDCVRCNRLAGRFVTNVHIAEQHPNIAEQHPKLFTAMAHCTVAFSR